MKLSKISPNQLQTVSGCDDQQMGTDLHNNAGRRTTLIRLIVAGFMSQAFM